VKFGKVIVGLEYETDAKMWQLCADGAVRVSSSYMKVLRFAVHRLFNDDVER
jgi:hypothetical protein